MLAAPRRVPRPPLPAWPLLGLLAACGPAGPGAGPLDLGGGPGMPDLGSACRPAPQLTVVSGSTAKLCQMTGETDRQTGQPTLNQTLTRAGLSGTDLGASFEHGGRLWFLFGDSMPTGGAAENPRCGDAIAATSATTAGTCVPIDFVSRAGGGFQSPAVPGIDLGCFDVPQAGVSTGPAMYVWFSTGCMSKSVLARSADNAATFSLVGTLSDCGCAPGCVSGGPPAGCPGACHFVNVSAEVVPEARAAGLPGSGDRVLLFGSGAYRGSDVYLAVASLAGIEDRASYVFYAGAGPGCGPRWTGDEAMAAPVLETAGEDGAAPCVGEISVHWEGTLQRWVALYNCGDRIDGRIARAPFGPYGAAQVVFDPHQGGDCQFIYQQNAGCPQLSDPGRAAESGGVYGPYWIPRYTTPTAQGARLRFLMSTWNPYEAVLMETELHTGP